MVLVDGYAELAGAHDFPYGRVSVGPNFAAGKDVEHGQTTKPELTIDVVKVLAPLPLPCRDTTKQPGWVHVQPIIDRKARFNSSS